MNTIQIGDDLAAGAYAELRTALPGVALVQVIHVDGEDAIARAAAVAPYVDAILLDSGNQKLAVKELGGTGRRHDWTVSRRIREAGRGSGLPRRRPARRQRRRRRSPPSGPSALDVCSGVRTAGGSTRPAWRPSSPR